MRIVFFTHYFPPEGNAPASRTYEHCARWVEAGHQVQVITCAPNVPNGVVYEGYKNPILPKYEVIDGVEVLRVWTYVAANAGGTRRILNYISYMLSSIFAFIFYCRRPDLIVATSPQFFCGWAGATSSILKWCPFVLEIRDIWPESIVAVGALKKGIFIRFLEALEKRMYLLANHIVAVGNGYRDNIVSKIGNAKPISVVTNGVDSQIFQPKAACPEFLKQYQLENRFVCSYVGTLGMAHGLDVVVRAAKLLKEQGRDDIAFCLVGDGARRTELERMVNAEGLDHWVKFTGRLPKSEMPTVLASSSCLLVHLMKTELFTTVIPSKIFESMAMNRPLIMGVRGDSAEIVEDAGCGVSMEPDNEQELVDAVVRLCDDKSLYTQLCGHGRESVSQQYNRDTLAERMLKIMLDVANTGETALQN